VAIQADVANLATNQASHHLLSQRSGESSMTKDPIVLNIPHARWEGISEYDDQYIVPEWVTIYETMIQTDWYTDKLFAIDNVHKVTAKVNRILVDTERFLADESEPMALTGRGCLYTHGSRGQRIRRTLSEEERNKLLDLYYHPHHKALDVAVQASLDCHNGCLLIDCHSFPDQPFPVEKDEAKRPDICLGTTNSNTPRELVQLLVEKLTHWGYNVAINTPYSGCVLPEAFQGDKRVLAVMIEVNRKLYLDQRVPEYSQDAVKEKNLPIMNSHSLRLHKRLVDLIRLCMNEFVKPSTESLEMPDSHPQNQ
tara:strand:- start:5396 stop:6325 length:930 start_codon:yes stop_codon:yes gene_type:complete